MAWVNGRYRHSVRINGRVTTEYYPREDEALFAASFLLWAEDRAEARECARAEDERLGQLHEAERDSGRAIRDLVEVYLEAAGYHRPARRRWRRRMSKSEMPALPAA